PPDGQRRAVRGSGLAARERDGPEGVPRGDLTRARLAGRDRGAEDGHDAERDAGAAGDDASPSIRERPPVATATLVRMGGAGRRTTVPAAAIAGFVRVAIVKPWPSGTAPVFSFRPGTPPPTEAPSADPLAALRLDCQDPPGWRIFSREVWPGGVLRSWRSMIPLAGPATP